MIHWKQQAVALTVAGIAAITLVGCSSGGGSTKPTSVTTVTATTTPSTASSSPSSAPSTSSSSPSATSTDGQGGSTSGGGTCTAAQLTGGTGTGSGGAAGSTYIHLTFTNKSSTTCTLQGWPGVSFVGHGNGTQIGAAATFDRVSPHPTVTLAPGSVAVAPLKITQAANYDASKCQPLAADGFRVYPPGSKTALYVSAPGYTACQSTSVGLLNVQGIVADGAATD